MGTLMQTHQQSWSKFQRTQQLGNTLRSKLLHAMVMRFKPKIGAAPKFQITFLLANSLSHACHHQKSQTHHQAARRRRSLQRKKANQTKRRKDAAECLVFILPNEISTTCMQGA